jgi:hypothetical protein
MAGNSWSEEDDQVIRDNAGIPVKVLADKIGRSVNSVSQRRHRLLHGRPKVEGAEYDERPSGWYSERIGTLLLNYQDAYQSWKHFHGYTEVKHVDTGTDGWTTLLCRRDANA